MQTVIKSRKKDTIRSRVSIEFDLEHLPVLVTALETYSRLQSGQIGMAMDEVYADRWLSWDEREYIEKVIRYIAFPQNPRREYDGHGEFYDQYNNVYNENGQIVDESEEWKRFKDRPHLDHANSSFGVGCKEAKTGTIAWEIKKAIQEYLHYKRNDGYRDMGVDGDGVLNVSGIPSARVLDQTSKEYWKPQKEFKIPQKYQEKINTLLNNKDYSKIWDVVDKAFKKTPLPKGSSYKIEQVAGVSYVIVEKPCKS